MTSFKIDQSIFPDLSGKTAVISGGSSGIGLATARILLAQKATVYILDLHPPKDEVGSAATDLHFLRADVSSWTSVRATIQDIPAIDLVFANAGAGSLDTYFTEDKLDERGQLIQPAFSDIEVNIYGTLNLIKACRHKIRTQGCGGSVVITASSAGYTPETWLPIYSASKAFLLGLVRALRPSMIREGISINAVAPTPTLTGMLPKEFSEMLKKGGIDISSPHDVGLALVYSAVAKEERRVEIYGKDTTAEAEPGARWNGRVIWVRGNTYTEVEEPLQESRRDHWLGAENEAMLRKQQALMDIR